MALVRRIEAAGGTVDVGADPIALMKAVKNEAEIAGSRAAHLRDGVAVARFLAWLDREAPRASSRRSTRSRRWRPSGSRPALLKDLSFPSISGAGPNAALPHYRVTSSSNRPIEPNQIFLIDSGAQYEDGTTDITRTIIVGEPTPEMKDRFTRVLKGHIAIAQAVFPKGTTGAQIDAFARKPLWEAGLDFDHGTGHGIGSYLSVHEGPQRIAKTGHTPLEPGMMLSNEPGYYKAGDYGIRIENLILVEPRTIAGGDREMLGFETLTFAPIDLRLVEPALMTADEIAWLDAYHASVREKPRARCERGVATRRRRRRWLDVSGDAAAAARGASHRAQQPRRRRRPRSSPSSGGASRQRPVIRRGDGLRPAGGEARSARSRRRGTAGGMASKAALARPVSTRRSATKRPAMRVM